MSAEEMEPLEFDTGRLSAEDIGKIFLDAVKKVDNWDPCTCPMSELQYHVEALESIECLLAAILSRPSYLRGVLSARTIHEVMNFSNKS